MPEVVIVEAVRSPIGRRNGGLSTLHPAELLSRVQKELIDRSGIDPSEVGQVVGGCVSQVGEQAFNVARTAWLSAGLPLEVPATTIDTQCGSSQQATNLAAALVGAGVVDVAVACGVESMSRIPIGASGNKKLGFGVPLPKTYFPLYEPTSQFEGAERIADKWGVTRQDCDEFGLQSQQRAAAAWAEDRFSTQILPIDAPDLDDDGKPTGSTHHVARDEGLRDTTLEALANLKPVARENGVHTAGSASQISDGAAAVLMMTAEKAAALGLTPRARIVDTCLVGVDPVLMLTGPIDATQRLLQRTGMTMADIDLTEINEAFASVVLAWERELKADPETTNPNGGAIALGHPLGGTGAFLMTKAIHELERTDGTNALVTMCCGGGLGTGTIIQRAEPGRVGVGHLLGAIAGLALAALVVAGCGGGQSAGPATTLPHGANATVVRVVDGDTIIASIGGSTQRIRLIGMDTPETVDPRKPVQCYGPQASKHTKSLLPPGTPVKLVRDEEAKDIYGRTLAYVYRAADNLFVERELLADGYARTLTIPPNDAHESDLAAAQRSAQQAGKGLWSACPTQ